MKLDKAEKRAIAIFASLFVIFLGLTVACIIRWRVDNTQEFTTKITVEDRPANKEEKNNTKVTEFVAMEKTKSWPSEDTNGKTIIGAEYDGTVYNNSGKSIVNWSMTIYMPIGKKNIHSVTMPEIHWPAVLRTAVELIYIIPASRIPAFNHIA